MKAPIAQRAAAEALGTAALTVAVVGSGIMAERLASGNTALALLANSIATGAALVTLIVCIGPISGAHINPVVTLVEALRGRITASEGLAYVLAQCFGAIAGVACANRMYDLPLFAVSHHARTGGSQWFSEVIATFGLILVIQACAALNVEWIGVAVACYIASAYWFTSSTSFANPALTMARSLSDTFAGIRPADVLPFIAAQVAGACIATVLCIWFSPERGDA
jgi:glycerol uptake facilitator-like aquaporin